MRSFHASAYVAPKLRFRSIRTRSLWSCGWARTLLCKPSMLKRGAVFGLVISTFACAGEDELTRNGQAASRLDEAKALDETVCEHSPIVLDMNGDGITLSDPRGGVLFDLRETGRFVRTAWPSGGDGLLVFDRDGDGRIAHGGELFGNSLKDDGTRWKDGFSSLAALDVVELGGNNGGVIDAKDEIYTKLAIWRDTARDGATEPSELTSLSDAGIVSLSVAAEKKLVFDHFGNTIPLWGEFIREETDGALVRGTMADAWFRIRAAEIPATIARAGAKKGVE
jgi:hypothetical protein